TAPAKATIGYYLSKNYTFIDPNIRLAGIAEATYAPGVSVTLPAQTLTIPNNVGGNWWIGILLDETNTASESNEGNNSTGRLITVTSPDLRISAPLTPILVPATVGRGGSVTWPAWTLNNSGPVAASQITCDFYLGKGATPSPTDRRLAGFVQANLAGNTSITFQASPMTIPTDVTPGAY